MLEPKQRILFSGSRAVPAHVAELVAAFSDAGLGALTDDGHGYWPAPADGALSRRQPGQLVTDDVRSQRHHGRPRPEVHTWKT